ncbi:hypothetical protein LEP1GSC193_0521 [Leptospira alstonii serovar Pingchang str. 80-412]|uniref:Uncharacterized protein n=2 Tax=Leptospira alstonii TaxID=28452 RepID=M6CKD8_9LEPT|nr:hypothetical protein LEP1GSC194_2135 [Leptospira alstonii serovar Sichuan str. 79601]EQA79556.1 hypothetical protein LEP1GSC193_0521 [Leptospira alstonii serovar Pingchang str. 80-412]
MVIPSSLIFKISKDSSKPSIPKFQSFESFGWSEGKSFHNGTFLFVR